MIASANFCRFLSTLSLRRATIGTLRTVSVKKTFLSTLSLRRATNCTSIGRPKRLYFYPRSPCGERHTWARGSRVTYVISIHALLAESDKPAERHANSQQEFLSTLSLRRATGCGQYYIHAPGISIHALLAESDKCSFGNPCRKPYFYPRSPCGERQDVSLIYTNRRQDFYPRSPCGERRGGGFLSFILSYFYPRSPCGERQLMPLIRFSRGIFLSTLSLRRATV